MYVDFDFYQKTYGGEVITADRWEAVATRADVFIDRITFNRLQDYSPEKEAHWISIRFAVCALAELMDTIRGYKAEAHRAATAGGATAQGGRVKSVTSGRESITYAEGTNAITALYMAAENPAEEYRLYYKAVEPYLADIPDARGINLLYAGFERGNNNCI